VFHPVSCTLRGQTVARKLCHWHLHTHPIISGETLVTKRPTHFLARDEAVAQKGAQNSVTKGVHFGTHRSGVSVHASHEALTFHSLVAHLGSPCSRGASV
jgi:hypothetical protein